MRFRELRKVRLTTLERSVVVITVCVFLLVLLYMLWPEPAVAVGIGGVAVRRGALEMKRWKLVKKLGDSAEVERRSAESRALILENIRDIDKRLNGWP